MSDPSVDILLREYERDKIYGSVEIKFEAGRVVLIKRVESIKPLDYRNPRDKGEQE